MCHYYTKCSGFFKATICGCLWEGSVEQVGGSSGNWRVGSSTPRETLNLKWLPMFRPVSACGKMSNFGTSVVVCRIPSTPVFSLPQCSTVLKADALLCTKINANPVLWIKVSSISFISLCHCKHHFGEETLICVSSYDFWCEREEFNNKKYFLAGGCCTKPR